MRKSKLKAAEIEEAELTEHNRRQGRASGFSLLSVRDRGGTRLSNGVIMEWPVAREKRAEGVAYPSVPEGHFGLRFKDQAMLFDADDFRKYLRWV